ncbi:hypothetical protein BC936DRAFT_147580 [Jimgerdemannia flammicorona]|uniref:Uncharacterized protein n=1 Tax=Jimgerdemannia flammicorona TaxID=994334 RepID=A0A433DNB7_9FUNG|nr:hypothetical protein BC936DRAFT_147580 [Jimgerdemannia flammicorona]
MQQISTCVRMGCMFPAFFDRSKNIHHPFCSKTCASSSRCKNPNCISPLYVDPETGTQHPYCSRSCALLRRSPSAGLCSRQGCNNPRYTSPQNPPKYYDYCTPNCLWKETESLTETKLTALSDPANNLDYLAVKTAFNSPGFTIKAIFRIQYPPAISNRFLNYREQVRATSNAQSSKAITIKRFHGTRNVQCVAVNEMAKGKAVGTTNFCSFARCGPCGIIKTGLRGGNDGRVWSGGSSATSHSYTITIGGENTRVMFLCDAVGQGLPEAAPVACVEAILPRFLILYS